MNRTKRILAAAAALALAASLAPSALAQTPADYQKAIDAAYAKYKDIQEGKNADYIPALAKVDPKIYGIALVTTDGKVYTAGDLKSEVSIQSISKVFTMAKVAEESGFDTIVKTIGVDATGMRFNSIVVDRVREEVPRRARDQPAREPGRDHGDEHAQGQGPRARSGTASSTTYSDFAGRPLSVNQDVFKSESDTNQRNQAIGYLMYAYEYIKAEPLRATDIYTEQCSVNVNAKDLAVDGRDARERREEPADRQAGHEHGERARDAGRHGDRGPLRRLGQVVLPHGPSRPRAAWAAASSPSRRASSGSP